MYIPQDPPLVLHMLTSWGPVVQPVTAKCTSAEVGLGLDSKGQSPGQKTGNRASDSLLTTFIKERIH